MNFRWSLLFTRIAILLLIAAAIWIGRDALIRQAMITKAESAIGAKVEIAQIRSSLTDGKVYLKNLAIADPRSPMTNLIQAESAIIRLDQEKLSRRQFVIVDGTASRVVFGAPRSKSGALAGLDDSVAKYETPPNINVQYDRQDARAAWLDRFQYAIPAVDQNKLELVKVSDAVFRRWNSDLQHQRDQVDRLKTSLRQIHDLVTFDSNPLRNQQNIESAQNLLASFRKDIESIAGDLSALDQQLVADRDQLLEAKNSDAKKMLSDSQLKNLDGDTITRLLLNENQIDQTKEILSWFYTFREMVPDPKTDFSPATVGGTDIELPETETTPSFLIQSMQLDGEGRLAGTKFNFSGIARNVTTEPELIDEPISFELRAQGNAHAFVNCILDRSTDQRNDSIKIHCPDLPIQARLLGDDESLKVNISPCRTHVDISLECINGMITGRMDFDHSNLVIQIEHLDELAGGNNVAQRINLELASISEYKVQTIVSGPANNPTMTIESDLGNRLALKFNEIINQQSQIAIQQLDSILKTKTDFLDREISESIRSIAQQLETKVIDRKTAVAESLNRYLKKSPVERPVVR